MADKDFELKHNKEEKKYYFEVDDYEPKVEYELSDDKRIFLTHTFVHDDLGGKGIASQLLKKVLEDIKKTELTIVPVCPFVAGYMGKHKEWQKLIFRNVNLI